MARLLGGYYGQRLQVLLFLKLMVGSTLLLITLRAIHDTKKSDNNYNVSNNNSTHPTLADIELDGFGE